MAKGSIGDAIAKTLGDVSRIDTAPIQYIPIERLFPNKRNFYPAPEPEALTALEESIAANGLLEPLTVVGAEDGTYRLISGHSRLRALRNLHDHGDGDRWDKIPCVVLPPMSEAQEVSAVIEANRQRVKTGSLIAEEGEKLTQAYVARQRAGEDLPGRIRDRVAKQLEISASKLAMAQATRRNLKLPGFQAQWKDGEIGDTVAYEISKLSHENQYRLLDWLCDNHRTARSLGVWEVKNLGVEFEFTKRNCPKDPDGKQCTNAARMRQAFYRGGNWNCAGCCAYCNKRDACQTVCVYCAPKKPEPEKPARNPALDDPRLKAAQKHDIFCKRLGELRKQTGMDRKTFAASIEEYPGTYSAWENASLPSISGAIKLAVCLGVSLDFLVGLTDDPTPKEARK